MKIAVLGDAFVDKYHVGKVRGLSAESPIPIVDKMSTVVMPGGAGNVTLNLQSLGADVFFLERPRQNYPIKNRLMTDEGVQLARWDEEDWSRPYTRADLAGLLKADAIIVSDYGKGAISEEVIQLLKVVAKPIFVDTKSDPSPWIGSEMATLFPNWKEYKEYEDKYNWFPRVVLKRGANGLGFLEYGHVVLSRPAQAHHVRSVNGAGDTVIAAFTLGALAELTLPECLSFANAAAANVVEQPFINRWTTHEAAVARMEFSDEEDAQYSDQCVRTDTGDNYAVNGVLLLEAGSNNPTTNRPSGVSNEDGARNQGIPESESSIDNGWEYLVGGLYTGLPKDKNPWG